MCPCCKKHMDSGHHAVALCPGIQQLVQEKHNAAVRIITKAIANGDLGADSIAYNDGGNATKWHKAGAPQLHRCVSDVPAELREDLKACHTRPDIILYRRREINRTSQGLWHATPAQITLIEIKYVRDTDPSRTMRDPYTQHSRLYEKVCRRHPSAIVRRQVILLGVAGSVYTEQTLRPLEQLGIRGQLQKSTIHKLQRHAIQALHTTWKQRQANIRKGQQQHTRAPVEGQGGGGNWGGGRVGGDERDVGGGVGF
jgi:hypothetical protein